MAENLDFSDLEIVELTIPVNNEVFLLREASGDAGVRYKNACLNATRVNNGKVSGFNGLADVEPLLISMCLFHRNDDGTRGKLVDLNKIKAWPYRVQRALFEKAKDISGIREDEETVEMLEKRLAEAKEDQAEVKNERDAMTAGSG